MNARCGITTRPSHVKQEFVEEDMGTAVKDSDLVLILSDHSEFKQLTDGNFDGMRNRYILDTKNVVKTKDEFEEVKYYNFGNLYNL